MPRLNFLGKTESVHFLWVVLKLDVLFPVLFYEGTNSAKPFQIFFCCITFSIVQHQVYSIGKVEKLLFYVSKN